MHGVYLSSFLERWHPVNHALSFGCDQCYWESYYPNPSTLLSQPRLRELNQYRLHRILYVEYEGALHSLQLIFQKDDGNTLETPVLKGREIDTSENYTHRSLEIENDKTV